MKSLDFELARLRRLRKIQPEDMDLVFAAFYLAGQFGQNIPTDFGREAFAIIREKLNKSPAIKQG